MAALSLIAAPAQSGTIASNDVPDMALQEGTPLEGVDLGDFFASPTSELTYSVEGGSVDGSVATIFAEAGTASFTATDADGDSVSDESSVTVGSTASGLMFDDNNRIAGVNGGNLTINGILPGNTVNSVVTLVLPGGAGTPGGGTPGGAAASVAIGTVDLSYDTANTGLRSRVVSNETGAGGTEASNGGLTATLNGDGSYNLATTSDFNDDMVVTFGSTADAVHVVAAPAVAANVNDSAAFTAAPAGGNPQADVSFGGDGITVTAEAGEAVLIFHNSEVDLPDGYGTVSVDYNSNSADVVMAVGGFAGGLGTSPLFVQNNVEIEEGVTKNAIADVSGDSVTPLVQIVNTSDSSATVVIEAIHVIMAQPLHNYALNPNKTADLMSFGSANPVPVDGSVAGIENWFSDVLSQGAAAATLSDDNNWDTPTTVGSLELAPSGDLSFSNVGATATLGQGSYMVQAYVKALGDSGQVDLVAINLTNNNTAQGQVFAANASEWTQLQASGTTSAGGDYLIVAQAVNGSFRVDDIQVFITDENEDSYFDASLVQ